MTEGILWAWAWKAVLYLGTVLFLAYRWAHVARERDTWKLACEQSDRQRESMVQLVAQMRKDLQESVDLAERNGQIAKNAQKMAQELLLQHESLAQKILNTSIPSDASAAIVWLQDIARQLQMEEPT